jgi:CBS domain containing-hemolysin-like protein
MGDFSGFIWLAVLLVTNGFFVGAEFAVISARRAQIEPLANSGNQAAKLTLRAMENVSLMLATAQLGITVSSLLILLLAEPAIQKLLEPPLSALGLDAATSYVTAFIIALILVTYLHVVLGEMLPKNFAISVPDRAALILAPALYAVAQLVRPLVGLLNSVSNVILRLFGFTPRDEANTAFTLEQVEGIVEESTREGKLRDSSGTISKAFEFTEKRVIDIAVPIDELIPLGLNATVADLQQLVAQHGYSRYPVVVDGEAIGYWHLKDSLLDDVESDQPLPSRRLRSLISLAETEDLEDALAKMRKVGAHVARSFDSTGTVRGLLFLEDIIEELVGEIEDATRGRD